MKIINVIGREVLDSRGFPTVEAEFELDNGSVYRAMVPSGASTGSREGLELRDNDKNRFIGKGVLKAVNNINTIIKNNIIGKEVNEVDSILLSLDKTNNKNHLGVNAILPVSMCAFKSTISDNKNNYEFKNKREPFIMCNIINGGSHADNKLDIQEFMIIPKSKDIFESIRMSSEVFHNLKSILKENDLSTAVGDEGGFSPDIKNTKQTLDLIMLAIKGANYVPGVDIYIGLDVAGTQLFEDNCYLIDGNRYDRDSFIMFLLDLVEKYPIISIEDPLHEDDFEGFAELTRKIGDKVMIVGDDLFTTNLTYLKKGIEMGSCNAILIKPNQIGTVKEVSEVVELARKNNYKVIFSHRSGETEDSFIADLAIYFNSDYVKFGSMSRGERTSKYNELIRIFENND